MCVCVCLRLQSFNTRKKHVIHPFSIVFFYLFFCLICSCESKAATKNQFLTWTIFRFSFFTWSNIKRKTSEHLLLACHFLHAEIVWSNFLSRPNWYYYTQQRNETNQPGLDISLAWICFIRPFMRVGDAKWISLNFDLNFVPRCSRR